MPVRSTLTSMKLTMPLILVACLMVFITFEARAASEAEANTQDMSYLLDCGYIRRNIANTILHPNFVLYLSRHQKKYNILNKRHVKNAVAIWNTVVADKRKKIHYQQQHFDKLAMLSNTVDEYDNGDSYIVNAKGLAVLRYWMSDLAVDVAEIAVTQPVKPSGLEQLNVENNRAIGEALEILQEDPIGRQLIAHAIREKITIRSEQMHHHKGYYECPHKTIVIDPTVASYIFKINCIIHELVHATNPDDDNSVTEETIAEIIGMAVQDRITDIDISCNPYVVFVDRLLDPQYGEYHVDNNIHEHLKQAGIIIRITGE